MRQGPVPAGVTSSTFGKGEWGREPGEVTEMYGNPVLTSPRGNSGTFSSRIKINDPEDLTLLFRLYYFPHSTEILGRIKGASVGDQKEEKGTFSHF